MTTQPTPKATNKASEKATSPQTPPKGQPAATKATEPKRQPTTGPRSGKVTNRKPNPKDNGHSLVRLVGPYATKSGRFEVTYRCQCGHESRPYVKAVDDLDTARKAHARHAAKALAAKGGTS